MSYYYRPNINYSVHGLERAKERLKLKDHPDWEVKAIVKQHIQNSTKSFHSRNVVYVSASNTDIYFVIDEKTNTIITVTQVSVEKQWRLMEGW